MLEPTKMQTTDESVEIQLRGVPSAKAELVKEAIEKILDQAGISFKSREEKDDRLYSVEDVFPDFHIGHALRGLRLREGLTQKNSQILWVQSQVISLKWKMVNAPLAKRWPNAWLRP